MDTIKKVIKEKISYKNGQIQYIEKFDENENLNSFIQYEDGKIIVEAKSLFDQEINIWETVRYDNNGQIETKSLEYSSKGKTSKIEIFNKQGNLLHHELLEYDTLGNLIKKVVGINQDKKSYLFKYDQAGNQVFKQKYNHLEQLQKTQKREFNSFNQELSWKKFDKNGVLKKFQVSKYNQQQELIQSLSFERPDSDNFHRQTDFDPNADIFNQIFKVMEVFKYDINQQKININLDLFFFDELVSYGYDLNKNLILKTISRYRSDFSTSSLTLWSKEEKRFDENNLLIFESDMETHTDWDDYSETWYQYQLNQNKQIIQKLYRRKENQVPFLTENFSYHSNGILSESITKSETRLEFKRYDFFGNLVFEDNQRDRVEIELEYYDLYKK